MNINAPSYTPSYGNYTTAHSSLYNQHIAPTSAVNNTLNTASANMNNAYCSDASIASNTEYTQQQFGPLYDRLANFSIQEKSVSFAPPSQQQQQQLPLLKMELLAKDQIIKSLSEQLATLKKIKGNSLLAVKGPVSVPESYHQHFRDLATALQQKKAELDDTKLRLEAIVVAASIFNQNGQPGITVNGQYDAQDLAHKLISKLSVLQAENENLLKMVSYSGKLSLVVELGLVRAENKALKKKIEQLASK